MPTPNTPPDSTWIRQLSAPIKRMPSRSSAIGLGRSLRSILSCLGSGMMITMAMTMSAAVIR